MNLYRPSVLVKLFASIAETFDPIVFSDITNWKVLPDKPLIDDTFIGSSIEIQEPVKAILSLFMKKEHLCAFLAKRYSEGSVESGSTSAGNLDNFLDELLTLIAGRFSDGVLKRMKLVKPELQFTGEIFSPLVERNQNMCILVSFSAGGYQVFCCLKGN